MIYRCCCYEKIGIYEVKYGEEKNDVFGKFFDEVWDEKGGVEVFRYEREYLGGDGEGMGVVFDIVKVVKKKN